MVVIYLVRHGHTKFNIDKRLQGQFDFPLTKEGVVDAKKIAHELQDVSIDNIFSSDLKRAYQTAEIIKGVLCIKNKLIKVKALREINFGKASGLTKSRVRDVYPLYKKSTLFVFPNGESYAQVQKRVLSFIDEISRTQENKTVLIVTHSGCIRGIISKCKHVPLSKVLTVKISHEFLGKIIITKGKIKSYSRIHF